MTLIKYSKINWNSNKKSNKWKIVSFGEEQKIIIMPYVLTKPKNNRELLNYQNIDAKTSKSSCKPLNTKLLQYRNSLLKV